MSEKYYVVSESELNKLLDKTYADGLRDLGPTEYRDKLEAACRARPLDPQHMPKHMFKALLHVKGYSLKRYFIPEWATHFIKGAEEDLGDIVGFDHDGEWEEIKR